MSEESQVVDPTRYAYRAALVGPTSEFHLADDAIEWSMGTRSGRTSYRDIRRVRLAYRPTTLQNHRFVTEIWSRGGVKLTIASASAISMMNHQRHDAAYTAFVQELHRRLVEADQGASFEIGSPPVLYWVGFVIFCGLMLGVAGLVVRALQAEAWAAAGVAAALLIMFLWQTGTFFSRNRPGRYAPTQVPSQALP